MKTVLFICSLFLFSIAFSQEPNVNIIYGDYDSAVLLSEQENKPLLLIFGADWCGYCTQLKQEILIDNTTIDYITCVIDIDIDKKITRKYKVRSLPTSVILKKDKETKRKSGYKNKTDYADWLSN